MLTFLALTVKPYWKQLLLVGAAMLVSTLMSLAAPWPMKIVLDSVIESHPLPSWLAFIEKSTFGSGKNGVLLFAVLTIVVIAVLDGVSSYINSYFTTSIGQWTAHDMRRRVYDHLQRLSLSYYDRHETGPLISTITEDIDSVQDFASSSLLTILIDAFTIIGMLALMFFLNWNFTLIALSVTPLLLIFLYRVRRTIKTASREVRKKQSEIVSVVQEGLSSIRVIKAFARGEYEEQKLTAKSQESIAAALHARRIKSLLSPTVGFLVAIGTAFVVYFGAKLALAGQMTAGSLVVFLAYLKQLFKPIQELSKMTNTIAQASVGLERIKTILETDSRIPEPPDPQVLKAVKGGIEFDDVSFSYVPDRMILKNINFKIMSGQMVGIVGSTGGGKSTVASLIPRFYDPVSGSIRLDGVDVRQLQLNSLRNQMSFVLQETQLFHAPIWQNIAYGKPNASRDEIVAAAKLANAHGFIEKMEKGYDTMVGERGMTMSGGQRQRIGIARAIIRNTPVLILDEPSSGLDAESERLVFEALERLTHGKTTLVITHRLATIRNADLILVIKDGILIESGVHEALFAQGGFYAALCESQFQKKPEASLAFTARQPSRAV